MRPYPFRLLPFSTCLAGFAVAAWHASGDPLAAAAAVSLGGLSALGIRDMVQGRHAVLRNYPVVGHLRYLLESIRPEIQQYFIESDNEQVPFSRTQRSLVYARAKQEPADRPFGTLTDVYGEGHEFIGHSIAPAKKQVAADMRVRIGGPDCQRPYSASVMNVSAMSFGSLSANAIRALNKGAWRGGFAHDTGEGAISPYHLEFGGDLIWEIGSGYFGCRDEGGRFNPQRFRHNATQLPVKMIEIKLSQGAKPGKGGILPKEKITPEIAETRGIPMGQDCISPASHSAFSNPIEMMEFIRTLRELSGGKPVGFKMCVGHPWEVMALVKAMLETGVTPDFVVVDGSEGGTGAAPVEFTDAVGQPLRNGLVLMRNAIVGAGLKDRIRIGASGKIVSGFDIARAMALGADTVNSARGFMFALGCIQAQSCHTNRCPTGVATQDLARQNALVVPDKAERVYNFHKNTVSALADIVAAAGLSSPSELRPHHLFKRVSPHEVVPFDSLYPFLEDGELVEGTSNETYARLWRMARADSFSATAA